MVHVVIYFFIMRFMTVIAIGRDTKMKIIQSSLTGRLHRLW